MFITIEFEYDGDLDVHELLCQALHEGDDDAAAKLSDYVTDMTVVSGPSQQSGVKS